MMNDYEFEMMANYDFLTETLGISKDFVDGAICMGGYNMETLERVLFYHTGYRTFEQVYEEIEENG